MRQTLFDKINAVARRRQANWSARTCNPQTSFDTTEKLRELWAAERLSRARSRHGDRSKIISTARVERELERLMTDDTQR